MTSGFKRIQSIALAPLALLYLAGQIAHRRFGLQSTLKDRSRLLPLIVIGSLRAGGSGKTPVVSELARILSAQGKRVGILVYRLEKPNGKEPDGLIPLAHGLAEVKSDSHWHACSDEAVLLARQGGARVFVTRNREKAWDVLSRRSDLDLLISDDGLMDPRLSGAFHIVLRRPDETPKWFELLPAGPYHLTTGILRKFRGFGFQRRLIFPMGFDFGKRYWAFCGLGNPENFRRDLLRAGVQLVGFTASRDHALPNLKRVQTLAARKNAQNLLCTEKDGIKLAGLESVIVVREEIELEPGMISAIEEYLQFPATS